MFKDVATWLDLNGPVLSFTTNPTGATGIGTLPGLVGGGSVELTGIATASFVDEYAVNKGDISYQWYEEGGIKVSDGTYITGAATTILTLSNLITPNDNQRKFYLQAEYIPDPQSSIGMGYSTGNAWNEPFNSGIATVTVTPMIEIIAQPSSLQALVNTNKTFSVDASLTDNTYTDDLQYQWIVDGVEVSDGTVTKTTETGVDVFGDVSNTYTSDASHTVPATATNVRVTLAGAQGGNGGSDAGGPGGRGGQGRIGTLTLTTGKERKLEFKIGKRGNGGSSGNQSAGGSGGSSNVASGGNGGGAGQNGWSGGGGGGGGATGVRDTNLGSNYIGIVGGGAGGGGGSWNAGAPDAYGTQGRVGFGVGGGSSPTFLSIRNGSAGATKSGDGGGGGGGGGGANLTVGSGGNIPGWPSGGSGGGAGQDNSYGGTPGYGGISGYNNTEASFTTNSGSLNEGDGYASLNYRGTTSQRVVTTRNTIISGSKGKSLTLQSNLVGIQTVVCRISSATASNTPLFSDQVNFAVVDALDDAIMNIEEINLGDTANLINVNLANTEYTFYEAVNDGTSTSVEHYSFYSPYRDIDVEVDMYGGKGDTPTIDYGTHVVQGSTGGEGGFSRIQFTMEQNVEYVIAGLTPDIAAPFLYKKGKLVAVVGGGGDGETNNQGGSGGNGGGVDIAGGDANGHNGEFGIGGSVISAGALTGNGTFGSSYDLQLVGVTLQAGDSAESNGYYLQPPPFNRSTVGGRTISCAKGVYWAQQGKGACDDLGNVKFRLDNGTVVTNTSDTITRGFKAGYNIMQTAGAGADHRHIVTWKGAYGGNGATGGNGGTFSVAGGGGSGYQDGSVTVVSTMQGGSTGNAKVVLRVAT